MHRTSESPNSQLKIYVYDKMEILYSEPIDISEQVSGLKYVIGFGNIDNDEDIDFAITGLSNFGAQSNVYFMKQCSLKQFHLYSNFPQ